MTHFPGKLKKYLPIFALFQNACCEVQAGAPGEKRCDSKKKNEKKNCYFRAFFLLQKKNFVHTFLFDREKEF